MKKWVVPFIVTVAAAIVGVLIVETVFGGLPLLLLPIWILVYYFGDRWAKKAAIRQRWTNNKWWAATGVFIGIILVNTGL